MRKSPGISGPGTERPFSDRSVPGRVTEVPGLTFASAPWGGSSSGLAGPLTEDTSEELTRALASKDSPRTTGGALSILPGVSEWDGSGEGPGWGLGDLHSFQSFL